MNSKLRTLSYEFCQIPGLIIIKPEIYKDDRGSFCETFNKDDYNKIGIHFDFLQDNQSVSIKGVLRGLHFQKPPYEQGKLIRVVNGAVRDIVVDIRKNSPFYGKYYSIVLSEENALILWVPPGFAHGFLTLEDNTKFLYKCTKVYNKESEGSILWNDADLNIDWQLPASLPIPIVSQKDKIAPPFKELKITNLLNFI